MKTRLKGLLTGVMVFVMMLAGVIVVNAASGSITFGSDEYTHKAGDEFNIGVYVKGDVDIAAYTFSITYDKDKVEYISGADSGGNGKLSFAGTMSSDSKRYKKLWLTFKAKEAGTFTLKVEDAFVGPVNASLGDSLSLSKTGSSPITIEAADAVSSDCNLKSISIAETGFYGFSANKTDYDITVDNKYEKLTVSAKAADSKATVEISDTTLKVGNNKIYITVTAENKVDTKKYTIIVRRKSDSTGDTTSSSEHNTSSSQPITPPASEKKSYYSYGGVDLYFTSGLEGVAIPEGFDKVDITIEGYEYEVLANETGSIVLYYLVDAEGQKGCLYVYSSAKDAVYPYVVLANSDCLYMVDEEASPNVPDGYKRVNMVIKGAGGSDNEVSVMAWYHDDAPEFYLLYASCNGGEPALYQYDIKENTIQRYNGIKTTNQIIGSAEDAAKIQELEAKISELEKNDKSGTKTWMLAVIILAVLCIALIVVVIALFFKMREQMEYETYEDDDYMDGKSSRTSFSPSMQRRDNRKSSKSNIDDDDDFTFFDMDDDR